jgi:hypothetical protein
MSNDVVKHVNAIPVISADTYQHLGKFAGAMVLSCFEQIGGMERFAAWAETSPESFYTKIFTKMISRSQQVEITGTLTLDDAISRLESQSIDAEFEDVTEYDL